MRIAAADANFVPLFGEGGGADIGLLEHVAVARLDSWEVFVEPDEVIAVAAAGHAGEDVIDTEEESALGQVHQERDKIVSPLLELNVLTLMEVVNADVDFRTAGHATSQLLAEKESGTAAQSLRAIDAVVVGESEQGHAAIL